MTRKELRAVFPTPWRLSEDEIGAVLAADGSEVLQVDTLNARENTEVIALAEMLADLGNGLLAAEPNRNTLDVLQKARLQLGKRMPSAVSDSLAQMIREVVRLDLQRSELVRHLVGASHALKSYEFGNSAPDLARDQAAAIDALLARTQP